MGIEALFSACDMLASEGKNPGGFTDIAGVTEIGDKGKPIER
jgi:hypothetical protein